jgi:6-phosphofructokinase
MSRTKNLLVLPLVFVLLCTVLIANKVLSQDKSKVFYGLIQTVEDILTGKNIDQAKTTIAHGARLVYGTKFEDLRAVVAGEIKTCSLADTSYKGVMVQLKTNQSEDAGYVILKTQTVDKAKMRFHTVVFMKDSTGQLKIESWHTGDCDK